MSENEFQTSSSDEGGIAAGAVAEYGGNVA